MESVVLVIHLMLALTIIALVLLQRSEGGGLGIGGGGGGMGGLSTPQGTANVLTKATTLCAMCFFLTSLILGILAGSHSQSGILVDKIDGAPVVAGEQATPQASGEAQDSEKKTPKAPAEPSVPISE